MVGPTAPIDEGPPDVWVCERRVASAAALVETLAEMMEELEKNAKIDACNILLGIAEADTRGVDSAGERIKNLGVVVNRIVDVFEEQYRLVYSRRSGGEYVVPPEGMEDNVDYIDANVRSINNVLIGLRRVFAVLSSLPPLTRENAGYAAGQAAEAWLEATETRRESTTA